MKTVPARRLARRVLGVALGTLVLSIAEPSVAGDPSASDSATAESLFRSGRNLMKSGDYIKACAAFQASQRLDPAVGTLLNLANCYETIGKVASAWSIYLEAEGMATRADQPNRAELAREEAKALENQIPQVRLKVSGLNDSTRVFLDDTELQHGALALPFAIDPGDHRVRVENAEGGVEERTFYVAPVETENRNVVELSVAAPKVRSRNAETPAPNANPGTNPRAAAPAPKLKAKRDSSEGVLGVTGWLMLAVGAAAAGVGTAMALKAGSDARSAREMECEEISGELRCSDVGIQKRTSADRLLVAGQVVAYTGAAASVGGLALVVVSSKNARRTSTVQVSPQSVALLVAGTF